MHTSRALRKEKGWCKVLCQEGFSVLKKQEGCCGQKLSIRRQGQKNSLGTDGHDLLRFGKGVGIYSKCAGSS